MLYLQPFEGIRTGLYLAQHWNNFSRRCLARLVVILRRMELHCTPFIPPSPWIKPGLGTNGG